jgi:hypothetical protein
MGEAQECIGEGEGGGHGRRIGISVERRKGRSIQKRNNVSVEGVRQVVKSPGKRHVNEIRRWTISGRW